MSMIEGGRTEAMAQAVLSGPMFPPSFDGSPLFFGWALCSRLMILMLSAAIIVRIMSRMRAEDGATDFTTTCIRLSLLSMFWNCLFGSASDVITWLAWGEIDRDTMSMVMAVSRILDGLSAVPFVMSLFVPAWVFVAVRMDIAREPVAVFRWPAGPPWGAMRAPLSLAALCFVSAVGVTIMKWAAWHAVH